MLYFQEFHKAVHWCSELDSDLSLHSYAAAQPINHQYDQIPGYTTFGVEPSPCQMSLAASDFNSSPESVVSNRSGPMEYTDYRDGLPPVFISTQPRQETNRNAVTDTLYCNLYTQDKPNIDTLSANVVKDRYNPLLTATRGDYIVTHRGQFTGVPGDGAIEKEWKRSLLKSSSSKPWEQQVDVDLRRCITEERVSIDGEDSEGSVYFSRRKSIFIIFILIYVVWKLITQRG